MTDLIPFLRKVGRVGPAVLSMIDWYASGHATEQQLREHVDEARADTGDMITDAIAVYLACAMVGTFGAMPHHCSGTHGFTVKNRDGRRVDVDDVPAGPLARARMVTAVINSDALAARDVFVAYRNTHDHAAVSQFLAEFIISVYGEVTRRGMVIRR